MAAGISAAAIGATAAAASAAASIGTGIASSQSGKKAASKNTALQTQMNEGNKAILGSSRDIANSLLQPYSDLGDAAQSQLRYELGLGGSGTGQSGSLVMSQPTPYGEEQFKQDFGYTPKVQSLQDLQNTPGYQFELQQGLQSVDNSAAARGSLLSGKQLKSVNNYAQGVASQGYQRAWDRAQSAYQAAFNRNLSTQQNARAANQQRYNQLYGPTELGLNATQARANNSMTTANNIVNGNNNTAQNVAGNNYYAADQSQSNLSNINRNVQGLAANSDLTNSISGYFNAPTNQGQTVYDSNGIKRIY